MKADSKKIDSKHKLRWSTGQDRDDLTVKDYMSIYILYISGGSYQIIPVGKGGELIRTFVPFMHDSKLNSY